MNLLGVANGFKMMGIAFLLYTCFEVVGVQAVANQDPWEDFSQDGFEHGAPAAFGDEIEGGFGVGKDPEPAEAAADPPAGFIDVNGGGLEQLVADLEVFGLDFARHPAEGLGESARSQPQAEV